LFLLVCGFTFKCLPWTEFPVTQYKVVSELGGAVEQQVCYDVSMKPYVPMKHDRHFPECELVE
jgi:hypothetical protein